MFLGFGFLFDIPKLLYAIGTIMSGLLFSLVLICKILFLENFK